MRRAKVTLLSGALSAFCILTSAGYAAAALQECEPVVGSLSSVEGNVRVQRAGSGAWEAAGLGTALCDKDTVRTEANSRAAVSLVNDAVFRIDQNTAVHLADIAPEPEEKSFVQLLVGAIQSFSRKPREVAIDTPYLNATIEGTEFVIRVAQNETQLTVFEGTVRATNDQGQEAVTSGQMVVAQAGQAPQRRTVVRPRDAAQWSIYYPPVLAAQGGGAAPSDLPPAIAEAARLAGQGNAAGALAAMDGVPAGQQNATYHLYRASFLLAAGQVGEARSAIDRALQADSGSALAHALRAVIDVAQNRKDEGLANGRRAVELAPDSSAAAIALSYALQADYQLGEARQTMERAVAANPNDALARARLAELWMMVGYRDRARTEAQKAVQIAPNLERAQVVLGFANLVEIRTGPAKTAFNKALSIDSDDPMAHLGLGLAMIREGDLAQGRKQIEAAVALDPESALLRSYLGKGYFEEKREGLDAQQLAMAKEFDPNDPTAYLYDALRKQSENRPGEALRDLQKSIELNDNRAVYRGRLQLDEDRAARGASLANVYKDLGFTQMGLNEATKSLTDDPTNASAHRFMSDTYAGMRRREIARVSEQLQAQMLQDININPVSPSGSTANLGAGGGSAGFNEYTTLFERNRAQFSGVGGYGTDETSMAEGVVSAVHDWLSMSAGAYHYQTDGWRQNADIEHDIQNVYAQAALTPNLNIQLEYWTRESTAGDVALGFDPDTYNPTQTRNLEQDIARVGIRYSPSPNSDILFSYIYSDRDNTFLDDPVLDFGPSQLHLHIEEPTMDKGDLFEAQYLYRAQRFSVVAGGGLALNERRQTADQIVTQDFPGLPPGCDPLAPPGDPAECFIPPFPAGLDLSNVQGQQDIKHSRGYVYVNAKFPESVTWTLGASYDDLDFDVGGAEEKEFNPKFGVQWDVTDKFRVRGAAFQAVKPVVFANRTVEPTQVAGFNQLFDDVNGSVSQGYGLGADWAPTRAASFGIEATGRDFSERLGVTSGPSAPSLTEPVDREERTIRGYASWLPIPSTAVSAEAIFDRYRSDPGPGDDFFPKQVETISVPVNVSYFHTSGFLASVGATFIDQDVERHPALFPRPAGHDSFFTVDAAIGWRFKNRAGMVSLEARNLFDEEFMYLDDSYREFRDEPTPSPYVPSRTVMGRLSLRY